MNRRDQLKQLPMCRALTDPELDLIVRIAEDARLSSGESLFKEGEKGDALYVILDGQVRVTKRNKAGKEEELAVIGSGSVLGEMSLISGNGQRTATASAVSELSLMKIPAGRFSTLLESSNVAALKMVHHLAEEMARRLQLMNEKLVGMLDSPSPSPKKKEELAMFEEILTKWSF
jgi:CRP-like cAMP-binding protein